MLPIPYVHVKYPKDDGHAKCVIVKQCLQTLIHLIGNAKMLEKGSPSYSAGANSLGNSLPLSSWLLLLPMTV